MVEDIERFIENFSIPKECFLGKKIAKSHFYELKKMNTADKTSFSSYIDSIIWLYTLKKSTINIPILKTKELEYIEIEFIHVSLKEKVSIKKFAQIIHLIPYPIVLFFTYKNEFALCTALKRINQLDSSKLTIENYFETNWIDLSSQNDEVNSFLQSLQINNLSFDNFYALYQDICNRITAFELTQFGVSFSTDNIAQKRENIDKIMVLNKEIMSLKKVLQKETQFNTKVNLNIEIKKLSKKVDELKKGLE